MIQSLQGLHKIGTNLLYPSRCVLCDEVQPDGNQICKECSGKLPYVGDAFCMKCGGALEDSERELCKDCRTKRAHAAYKRGLAAFRYEGAIKTSMYAFKSGREEYASFYAKELVRLYGPTIRAWKAQVLVPVPLHPSKERKRGYNQSADLAYALSQELGILVDEKILRRVRKTKDQKTLSDEERKNNAKNAFQLGQSILEYRKIILVDDIFTTGMTMNACAKALKATEDTEIYYLTVCVGRGN